MGAYDNLNKLYIKRLPIQRFLLLFPLPPGGPGEGPDCHFPSEAWVLGRTWGEGHPNYNFCVDRKYSWGRSPELISVELCSVFQTGVVRNSPGLNFGRKPARKRPNLKSSNFNFNFGRKYSWVRRQALDATSRPTKGPQAKGGPCSTERCGST